MAKADPVRLMCAADRVFFRHVAVMLTSVAKSTPGPIEVGIVLQDVSEAEREVLRGLFPTLTIHFFDVKAGVLENLKFKFVLSPMTYARLLMADLVDWDRFVYLDTDLIVRHDLREMYEVDLGEAPLAGVFHGENLNAGVLLINGRVWRREGLMRQTLDFARLHTPKDADQGAIEGVLKGRIARLDPRWNVIVDPVWGKARLSDETSLREAWIVHFITGFKPWNLGRWLLPQPYLALWDANRVRAPLPRVLSAEIKTLAWQLRILAARALRRT